ncbi:MAG: hypothetical protein FJ125_14395 [Deltaproteobacteria bacterium]|nr:hypothetical protein [Deltaproteobacteria bacterium]
MAEARRLAPAYLWMLASTGVLNLAMVLYHRFASASLGEGYAQLAVVLGLTNISVVVSGGLAAYTAKVFAADAIAAGAGGVRARLGRIAVPFGLGLLALAALLAAGGPLLISYLRLPGGTIYAAGVAIVLAILLESAVRSAVQGLQRFGALGWSLVAEGAGRVGLCAALVAAGLGVHGALLAWVGAALLGTLLCVPPLAALPRPTAPLLSQGSRQRLADAAFDAACLGLLSLLYYLDLFVIKHHGGDAVAASYSRAALVAKCLLYAPSAVVLVLLPAVAAARAAGRDPRPLLYKALGVTAAILALGLAVILLLTEPVAVLLCGDVAGVRALAPLIRSMAWAVVPLALYQIVVFHQVAVSQKSLILQEIVVVVLYVAVLELWHDTPEQVVACLGVCATMALAMGLGTAAVRRAGSGRAGAGGLAVSSPPGRNNTSCRSGRRDW